jgi:hypothetical protein
MPTVVVSAPEAADAGCRETRKSGFYRGWAVSDAARAQVRAILNAVLE